jgi:hypothetical protein
MKNDRIAAYAMALQSDINTERFQVVENGKLQTYWMGTVYGGGVSTDAGFKFKTPEEAWENASRFVEQCAEIVSERLNKKGEE